MPIISSPSSSGSGLQEFDYVQVTANLVVTATTEGTAQTFITGNQVGYSGTQVVWIEVFAPSVQTSSVVGQNIYLVVFDGATPLGQFSREAAEFAAGAIGIQVAVFGRRRYTPSAGNHTFTVKAWTDNSTGSPTVRCGAGATGVDVPAYLRITS